MALYRIGNLLPGMAKRAGISKQLEASMICEATDKEIERIFGKEMGGRGRALYFKDSTLTMAVLSAAMAQEIRFREKEIMTGLNQRFGTGKIRRVRYLA